MLPFVLESARLRLEMPRTADVAAIHDACQDPVLQKYTTVPVPYTFADAQFFVSQVVERGWSTGREYIWGLREQGSSLLVAMVSIRLMYRDIGFWAAPEARGRGLTTEAVGLIADWAFAEGLPDILWEGYVGNLGSAGVARRAGFTFTGSGPGLQPGRSGSHPLCWKGRLASTDDRSPKGGWPADLAPLGSTRP